MSDYRTIGLTVSDEIATLTLMRPERLNALSRTLAAEMNDALDSLSSRGARAFVVTGAGRAFCSGADLIGEGDEPEIGDDAGEILETLVNPLMLRLADLAIPVIAAVNGPAAGVGCSIALAADFVIAARSAYFLCAFVNIGLVPDGGATWLLPRLVGVARATEMLMLGERVGAEQAAQWGMIYRMVEDAELSDAARRLAARLAQGPTRAYGLLRRAMRTALAQPLGDSMALERTSQAEAGRTHDFREGVAAFMEKRVAVFSGT